VARDRKRAKQRRNRRGTTAGGRPEVAPAVPPSRPAAPPSQPTDLGSLSADVPGALDHASGDVDEFDAALVRGAGGVAATPETGLEDGLPTGAPTGAEDELQVPEAPSAPGAGGGGGAGGGAGGDGGAGGGDHERPSGAPLRGGNRALAFVRASWAELQRVQWPDRRQVTQATAVVLGFVAIAGAYLGLADYVAKEIVEFVL
jgi:preprotein translocase subunit SecE